MSIGIFQNRVAGIRKVISGTGLIAGTTIGAGMLGIPLVTAKAGFLPALMATVGVWIFMALTGLLYVEVALSLPRGANILSFSGHYLGAKGRLFAGGMFLFLYYCLLVAYISGGSPLFAFLTKSFFGVVLSPPVSLALFALLFAGIVWCGAKMIDRVNLILSVALFGSYALLLSQGISEVSLTRLSVAHWSSMWMAFPLLFSAFGYHNIIPSLCTYFEGDRRTLRCSILLGTGLALIVYVLWQWLILGAIDPHFLQEALLSGQTATAALQGRVGGSLLFGLGQAFAFFALVTSFMGVALSVVDFLNDGLKQKGKNRAALVLLTFLPPGLFTIWDPTLFEKALSVAGGFGEAFLNGLLPILLMWRCRASRQDLLAAREPLVGRVVALFLLIFALFVMGLEGTLLWNG